MMGRREGSRQKEREAGEERPREGTMNLLGTAAPEGASGCLWWLVLSCMYQPFQPKILS